MRSSARSGFASKISLYRRTQRAQRRTQRAHRRTQRAHRVYVCVVALLHVTQGYLVRIRSGVGGFQAAQLKATLRLGW
eukprot:2921353-Pleurochrysis_carterae.AAC.1